MKSGVSSALILALACAGAAKADVRESLRAYFQLGPADSVAALRRLSPDSLRVEAVDRNTLDRRDLDQGVGAPNAARLLDKARAEGVPAYAEDGSPWRGAAPATPASPAPAAQPAPTAAATGPIPGSAASAQTHNRFEYVWTQTLLSTYLLAVNLPLAFQADGKVYAAAPLLAAPIAFGAHFAFAKTHPFYASHVLGTEYLSTASILAAHALPFALMSSSLEERYRVAAIASLAAYPLGLYGGYLLGDAYAESPGRIATQYKFAAGFAALGFFTPYLYFTHPGSHPEAIMRLGLGQATGFAVLGHVLADRYRTGQDVPGGVSTGILHHTLLGGIAGLEVASLAGADFERVRPVLGSLILGGTLGFSEGLIYYQDRWDSKERGLYNSLGMLGGTLFGSGLWILVGDGGSQYARTLKAVSLLGGGAWAGYVLTNWLTSGMEERPGHVGAAGGPSGPQWSFEPIPVPYAAQDPGPGPAPEGGHLHLGLRLPGLRATF